jgi:hypothetical protein
MSFEDAAPFRINPTKDFFEVVDDTGRRIIVCKDKLSADQYAALLNEAFRRGYKAGFRDAKRA